MHRVFFVFLLASATALSAQTAKIDQAGKNPIETKFAPGGRIRMDLCSSGVEVRGTDDSAIRVSYHPDVDDVHVRLEVIDNRADLRVTRCPHNNFRVNIEIPKSSDLYARMFAGQLNVRGVTGNKNVELSFGQLNVDMGDSEQYAHVDASVNSGQIQASGFGVNKGGLFRSFDRDGPGKYKVHAHVGAGQVDLQ